MGDKSILITGCSGFIGRNLVPFLESRGYAVQALSLRTNWQEQIPDDYTSLVHLAGIAHDTKHTLDPEEYFKINAELTRYIFEAFLQGSARDFIYFSSVKAVMDSVEEVLVEEQRPRPETSYGQSKLKAEEYLLSYKLPANKRLIIFRPCMIHGPRNKGNLNLLYQVVKRGIPWPLAAFENKRSFLSIQNLLFILDQVLDKPDLPGGIYNLADDDALSTNQVVKIMAEAANCKSRLWRCSPALIRSLASLGDIFHLPLNSERLKKLTDSYIVSNQKIKKALGIERLPLSARNGLIDTMRDFNRLEIKKQN